MPYTPEQIAKIKATDPKILEQALAQMTDAERAELRSALTGETAQATTAEQPIADGWQRTEYGFLVRPAVTPDGVQTVQREDGSLWFGPEQGNTGKAGWFTSEGRRAAPSLDTTATGVTGAIVRGMGPYGAAGAAGAAVGAPAGGIGAVPGFLAGTAAMGLTKLVGDPLAGIANAIVQGKDYGNVPPVITPPSETIERGFDWLGMPMAATPTERLVQTGSEALAGTGATIGLGQQLALRGGTVGRVGEVLASQPGQQLGGALGGALASQGAAEAGFGPGAQLGAGLLGGLAGGVAASPRRVVSTPSGITMTPEQAEMIGLQAAESQPPQTMANLAPTARKAAEGGIGAKRAARILAEEAAPDPKTVESARRLGISEYLQPDHVTTNQTYRELAQAVKSIPGSEARSAEVAGLVKVGERAERLISELGGSRDLSTVSQRVKDRLSGVVGELTNKADEAYDALERQIPKQTRGGTPETLSFLEQRMADLDGFENLSNLEKTVYRKLTGDAEGYQPTYALVDKLRREIGSAAKAKGPFADADTGLAKAIYRLIDNDQAAIASSVGMGGQYTAAKELVKVRKGFEDDLVALFGKQLDQSLVGKLGTATTSLSKGDAQKLANIMKAIPEDMRKEVAASAFKVAFGNATSNGNLNFNTFSKWFDGLIKNKQAYNTIMTNLDPEARKAFGDLYRVSKGVAAASRERILTGRIEAIRQEIQGADNLLSNIYGYAKRMAIGVPLEAGTTALGMPGTGFAAAIGSALTKGKPDVLKAADKLIASPEFVRMASSATSGQGIDASARALAKTGAFKRYASAARLHFTNEQEAAIWLKNSLQAQSLTEEPSR